MMKESGNKFMSYFRKPPDPKELVRKWQSDVRSEQRRLEKEIRSQSSLRQLNSLQSCAHSGLALHMYDSYKNIHAICSKFVIGLMKGALLLRLKSPLHAEISRGKSRKRSGFVKRLANVMTLLQQKSWQRSSCIHGKQSSSCIQTRLSWWP